MNRSFCKYFHYQIRLLGNRKILYRKKTPIRRTFRNLVYRKPSQQKMRGNYFSNNSQHTYNINECDEHTESQMFLLIFSSKQI